MEISKVVLQIHKQNGIGCAILEGCTEGQDAGPVYIVQHRIEGGMKQMD